MNQKQFITTGKGKLPVVILKWIWNNLDKIDMIIDFLQSLRKVNPLAEGDNCGPMPKYEVSHNGSWQCIAGEWKWIEDLG